MKPRKLTEKQREVRGAAFIAATIAILVRLGATPTPGGWHAYVIQTIHGPLGITPHERWIACRFDDMEQVGDQLYPPPNPFSGKWNFHLDGVESLPYFEHRLTEILEAR